MTCQGYFVSKIGFSKKNAFIGYFHFEVAQIQGVLYFLLGYGIIFQEILEGLSGGLQGLKKDYAGLHVGYQT